MIVISYKNIIFDPASPYNDLPPLPPAQELETKAILKLCTEARVALAESVTSASKRDLVVAYFENEL